MKKAEIKKIIKFLEKNEVSFVVPGHYSLPKIIVEKAMAEFLKFGKSDLIKKHKEWTYGCWDLNDECRTIGDTNSLKKLKKLKLFWGDNSDIEKLDNIIKECQERERIEEEYEYKRRAGFKLELKNKCKERDEYKCVLCNSSKNIEVDHIIELIDGGNNKLSNLQTLCKKCHRIKTNKQAKERRCKI